MKTQVMAALLLISLCGANAMRAQVPDAKSIAATQAKMTALRDSEIDAARKAGMTCTAAPPAVVVALVPSWGNYNAETNTITTTDWSQLTPRDRAFFASLAGPGATEDSIRQVFEASAQAWIFSHEIGHWIQRCQGQSIANRTPWQVELGANRIAWAYWRMTNPDAVAKFFAATDAALAHLPDPVPPGTDMVTYFNTNYGEPLARSNAYPWFQSKMVSIVRAEQPLPTLAEAVKNPAP